MQTNPTTAEKLEALQKEPSNKTEGYGCLVRNKQSGITEKRYPALHQAILDGLVEILGHDVYLHDVLLWGEKE